MHGGSEKSKKDKQTKRKTETVVDEGAYDDVDDDETGHDDDNDGHND